MALASPSLKMRALRLLGSREYSRAELCAKLARFEETPGSLAGLLDELQDKGFINEQRVLESVLHRRAGQHGSARIRQELQGKGLAPEAVAAAVAALQATERVRAQAVWRKKFGAPAADARAAGQQMRFMAARGFGNDVIRQLIKGGADDIDT